MDEIRRHMRRINKAAQSYAARQLLDVDLSPSQVDALRTISFHDGISQQALASHLGIDKAAVARIIAVLEKKGYITRLPDETDGRVKRVYATDQGIDMKNRLISGETHFFAFIFRNCPKDEMEIFSKVVTLASDEARAARKNGFLLEEDNSQCT